MRRSLSAHAAFLGTGESGMQEAQIMVTAPEALVLFVLLLGKGLVICFEGAVLG